jgi:hypothetical protein
MQFGSAAKNLKPRKVFARMGSYRRPVVVDVENAIDGEFINLPTFLSA